MVRGAARPVAAWLLALLCMRAAAFERLAPDVCGSVEVRNNVEQLARLRGCRIVEGMLRIVLLERGEPADYENVSFPELREVTGAIIVYRAMGMVNLGRLFPNLNVIRGKQLFKDFALVLFDNKNLQAIGLSSLRWVERGAVRIQNNEALCYLETIDWTRIVNDVDGNLIKANYDQRLCGLCPNAESRTEERRGRAGHAQCPTNAHGRLLCWDNINCQTMCSASCGVHGCAPDGSCCHSTCVGGCEGPGPRACHACRAFSHGYADERVCLDTCPPGTYEMMWRCVTEEECRTMPPPPAEVQPDMARHIGLAATSTVYKIFNRTCLFRCPPGYMEVGDGDDSRCQLCPDTGCMRECTGGKVDSVATAELFKGCTHIRGTLEISLRASGGNTMAVLEESLGEIREIDGGLSVSRSYPLVSLMFLKKLKRLTASPTQNKGQSLHIFNNPNLELLWDWSVQKPIDIATGQLFIHFNPKLCYNQILPLHNMTKDPLSTFSEIEVSEDNNGNQASCSHEMLQLRVHIVRRRAAILTWNNYCVQDVRRLLGYSIYYVPAEHNVTLYGQRDACSDSWNVLDVTMDEVRNNTHMVPDPKANILSNPCNDIQPLFYPLTQLDPYTRYAVYVKTYTTMQDKKGAQSSIIYFRTLPGRPSPVENLEIEAVSSHTAIARWHTSPLPNGNIQFYHVEINVANDSEHKQKIRSMEFCNDPTGSLDKISRLIITTPSAETLGKRKYAADAAAAKNASCACAAESRPGTKFTSTAEAERMDAILFENELQNQVYVKTEKNRSRSSANRIRRSAEYSSSGPLVITQEAIEPRPGMTYHNVTYDGGFSRNMFYHLSGDSRNLTLTNLRHFTWYTFNIWACRSKHANEDIMAYEDSWCSEKQVYNFRSKELINADVARDVRASLITANRTASAAVGDVNVTWRPPADPNGIVVAYYVHHARLDDSNTGQGVGLQVCLKADDANRPHYWYKLRGLTPGNYSVRVTPVSGCGEGNSSAPVYVFVPERSGRWWEWAWALAAVCVVSLGVCAAAWRSRRALLSPAEASKLFASVNPEYSSAVYVPDEWEVPRSSITFVRELGQGSFGMVYEGVAKNIEKDKPETKCAVKTVNEHATDRERIEFLNEASVMKAFDTSHVVRLLGVVSRGQPTLVVMELMELGDLKSFLRSRRPDADPPPAGPAPAPLTLQHIMQMAIEIADGMAYLSAKKFVHRDLAARNCMVSGDLTVKVGDFGMTRDIYETDYYRKGTKGLLPVRWMSPESLKDGVFSSHSDVWSFGVVLWEMATLAMQPYQGLSNEQVVRYVAEGGVMERPELCPDRLYELMRACWAPRPAARPSFLRLVADLAPHASSRFRQQSYFHSPHGQELYAMQRTSAIATEEETESGAGVNVGPVATGSGSNLFGVSGRLASWVRELSSLRARGPDDAAAEPLHPSPPAPPTLIPLKPASGPHNGAPPSTTAC